MFYRTILLRLPEIAAACRKGDPVWWGEGEKDALAVVAAGIEATTTALSAEGTGIDHALHFQRHGAREVVVIADVDLAGAQSAVDRFTLLRQIGLSARVLAPPKPYNDAAEALAAGHKLAHFRKVDMYRLTDAAHRYKDERRAGRSPYVPHSPSCERCDRPGCIGWHPVALERS